MRKLGLLLVLAATVTVVAAGGDVSARVPGLVRFTNGPYGITFVHLTEWRPQAVGTGGPHLYRIVALSTERLQRIVCHYEPAGGGASRLVCNSLLDALPPGGVFVDWAEQIEPVIDAKLSGYSGTPMRIGGLFAKIVISPIPPTQPVVCPKHATGSIRVVIAKRYGNSYDPVNVYACANTTDFPAFQNQVLAMLRSVQFHT